MTKVEEINETEVQQPTTTVSPGCYENGYESINPYLNPYAPVYYYHMPFYPVPGMIMSGSYQNFNVLTQNSSFTAIGPYSPTEYYQSPDQDTLVPGVNGIPFENGRHNKYPKRKKRYRKTLSSSGVSILDIYFAQSSSFLNFRSFFLYRQASQTIRKMNQCSMRSRRQALAIQALLRPLKLLK